MTTLTLIDSFSHGLTTLTANGGGIANTITGTPSTASSPSRSGGYSLKCSPTAGYAYVKYTTASTTSVVARFYLYVVSMPAGDITIAYPSTTSGDLRVRLGTVSSQPTIRLYDGSTSVDVASISLNTWVRIDAKWDTSTNPFVLTCSVDGGTPATLSPAWAGVATTSWYFGGLSSSTYEIYFDDLVCSQTLGDYPIGAGGIDPLTATSDGTHNSGTVMKNTGGTVIDGTAGKTAYTEVDEIPMDSTADYVQQTGTGSNYVEVNFDNTSNTSILGVAALLAYKAAGTQADGAGCTIIDEDATETAVWGKTGALADYSESSLFYKKVVLPTPAGGWDQGAVNSLKGRMGFGASDVNPVPQWHAIIIEVAYATSSGTQNNLSLSGSVSTLTGAISKEDRKTLTGSVATLVGTIQKQITKTLIGSVSSAGTLSKQIQRKLIGSIASAGAIIKGVGYPRTFTGGITPSGSAAKHDQKTLTGGVTSAGMKTFSDRKTLTGSIASSGAISYIRAVTKLLAGSISSSGTDALQTTKKLVGSIASAGSATKQELKKLIGSIGSSGAITTTRAILRTFAGSVTPGGTVSSKMNKLLTGTVASAGVSLKSTGKRLTGSVSSLGAVTKMRLAFITLVGAISPSGSMGRQISKTISGVVYPAGVVIKSISKTFTGLVQSVGGLIAELIQISTPLLFYPPRNSWRSGGPDDPEDRFMFELPADPSSEFPPIGSDGGESETLYPGSEIQDPANYDGKGPTQGGTENSTNLDPNSTFPPRDDWRGSGPED